MQETQKIRVPSRLLRSPQVFQQYGELAEGIARDVVIYLAMQNAALVTLRVVDFAELFGYNRSHLNKKKVLTAEQVSGLKRAGFREDDYHTALGYALCKLTAHNLIFPDCWRSSNATHSRYRALNVLKQLDTHKSRKGTVYVLTVNPELLHLCRTEYQTIELNEYKAILTPGGQMWDAGRRLYMHLAWKRQYWDKMPKQKGVKPSESRFDELQAVCGFFYGEQATTPQAKAKGEAKNASALRLAIGAVSHARSVAMKGEVARCIATGKYSVKFQRIEQQ